MLKQLTLAALYERKLIAVLLIALPIIAIASAAWPN